MLKGVLTLSLSSALADLFSLSLAASRVLSEWKLSNVTPIFKSGDHTLVTNYRPISLLSLSSKIMERLIHNALINHLLEHGLLSNKQFGFRSGSSTQEALLAATRDWHLALENRDSVACVFINISKAFDSLPHPLILQSLKRVGVTGSLYNWFVDYLTDRQQRVTL